jgi:hypothetical protein
MGMEFTTESYTDNGIHTQLTLSRLQMDSLVNYDEHGSNPVVHIPEQVQ